MTTPVRNRWQDQPDVAPPVPREPVPEGGGAVATRTVFANAASLATTVALGAGVGSVFWWLAARSFPPATVGLGAALTSAMTLLGMLGMLGLGTKLMAELPRRPAEAAPLVATAAAAAGAAGLALGFGFGLLAPALSTDLAPLGGLVAIVTFAVGVGLTALGLVVDQGLIGLSRAGLQVTRNALLNVAKLVALVLLVALGVEVSGVGIAATWVGGAALSFVVLLILLARAASWSDFVPRPGVLRGAGRSAAAHHVLNMALQASEIVLPVVVTFVLSATVNAYFYVGWRVAGLVYVAPTSLAIAMYAAGERSSLTITRKARLMLAAAMLLGLVGNLGLWLVGERILGLFGPEYAANAAMSMYVLGLAVFPMVVKDLYGVIRRIERGPASAARVAVLGAGLELGAAAVGGLLGGLAGLSIGWVLGLTVEAALMARLVLRTTFGDAKRRRPPAAAGA